MMDINDCETIDGGALWSLSIIEPIAGFSSSWGFMPLLEDLDHTFEKAVGPLFFMMDCDTYEVALPTTSLEDTLELLKRYFPDFIIKKGTELNLKEDGDDTENHRETMYMCRPDKIKELEDYLNADV